MIKFKQFYAYLFNFLKTEGQKSLSGEMATAVWGIVLARRFEIAKEFVEYTTVSLFLSSFDSSGTGLSLYRTCGMSGALVTGCRTQRSFAGCLESAA